MRASHPRFLLLQVISPHYHHLEAVKNMSELVQLVETYGGEVVIKTIQHRVNPHPDTYIGPGKLIWLKETVVTQRIDVVVINAIVKPSQLFRIEKSIWPVNSHIEVWDRIDLILNIFDKHAVSKEAKIQIELARLEHSGPRIYGLGGTVLSRQGGGIGQRGGFGETNIEFEKRLLKKRKLQLEHELVRVSRQKQTRINFRQEQGFGPVALVGYTSAGKTTLFNALTGKTKSTHAGLFTTLDTAVGKLNLPSHHLPILISDTIGFIQDLPPALIQAFRSTLMESMAAKLILHVVDASDPDLDKKITVVEQILAELQITQPILRVFNKTDTLTEADRRRLEKTYNHLPTYFISATTRQGIDQLIHHVSQIVIPL